MPSGGELVELLEIVASLDRERRGASLSEIASRLGLSADKTLEKLKDCVELGFIEQHNSLFTVTQKGVKEILAHRAEYLHDHLVHRGGGRLSRLLERLTRGAKEEVTQHLSTRHGLDKETSDALRQSLLEFKGQVEEVVPLTELKRGEVGEVAFVVAGRGLLARLAAMGIVPKVKVTVVRVAPLHGPIEVSLRGVSIILGYGVASKIYVRRSSSA
jgi:Fe2+ transport system protein FeoA